MSSCVVCIADVFKAARHKRDDYIQQNTADIINHQNFDSITAQHFGIDDNGDALIRDKRAPGDVATGK